MFGFLPLIEPSLEIESMKWGSVRTLWYYSTSLISLTIRIERDKNRKIDMFNDK